MKTFILLFTIFFSATFSFSQTITSTESGGNWQNVTTWIGGVVPYAENDVIINGPVLVLNYDNECNNLTVNADKHLLTLGGYYGNLIVGGNIVNNGTVSGGMNISVMGNIESNGLWIEDATGNPMITFTGSDQYISHSPGNGFYSSFQCSDSTVNIYFNSDIHLFNDGNTSGLGNAQIFTQGHTFKIDGGDLTATRIVSNDTLDFNLQMTGGNEISGNYVLKGTITAFNTNILRGTATNLGTLQALAGPYFLTIDGNINNYGAVTTTVHISGNIDNHGSWTSYETYFTGSNEKIISQSPDAVFQGYFIVNDPEATLSLGSDVSLNVSDFTLNNATLNCGPYSLTAGTHFINGTIISYGDITEHGYYELVTFEGSIGFHGKNNIKGCVSNGEIINYDTISQPYPIPGNYLTVYGSLVNEGLITSVPINLYGDLTNNGEINTANIIVKGDTTQYITLSEPINEQVSFRAMVEGVSYQWMKNGVDISGAFQPELIFNTLQISDQGIYQCRVETSSKETVYSREIIVDLSTGIEYNRLEYNAGTLSQNYPNPFQNVTTIPYQLHNDSKVELIVVDIKGNLIKTLIYKKQLAGKYNIDFQASGLPSGIYYYGLFIDGKSVATKKMILNK